VTLCTVETSPQIYARAGGVLYSIIIVLGAVGELFVRNSIVVPGDAATTTSNLRSMEHLWRLGIASELFIGICTIVFMLILYLLLRPVNRDLALLATFFGLVAMAVEIAYSLQLVQALFPLGNAEYLKAFTAEQLSAMSSLSIKAHSQGFGIALLFFGCVFPIAGYLIFKSGYFPKVIGILYVIPGVSYLTSSFALILAPSFAGRYYFVMAGPAVIGEGALSLWLLVKGVNAAKWEEKVIGSVRGHT
jgi:hypothetical protein